MMILWCFDDIFWWYFDDEDADEYRVEVDVDPLNDLGDVDDEVEAGSNDANHVDGVDDDETNVGADVEVDLGSSSLWKTLRRSRQEKKVVLCSNSRKQLAILIAYPFFFSMCIKLSHHVPIFSPWKYGI